MNTELENKKIAVVLLCAVIVLLFLGCQTALNIDDAVGQTDWYGNYQARLYEPAPARFLLADPQAEKYPGISPYAYRIEHPIAIDWRGDSLTVANDSVFFLIRHSAVKNEQNKVL